jgi:hypothetical protein
LPPRITCSLLFRVIDVDSAHANVDKPQSTHCGTRGVLRCSGATQLASDNLAPHEEHADADLIFFKNNLLNLAPHEQHADADLICFKNNLLNPHEEHVMSMHIWIFFFS